MHYSSGVLILNFLQQSDSLYSPPHTRLDWSNMEVILPMPQFEAKLSPSTCPWDPVGQQKIVPETLTPWS